MGITKRPCAVAGTIVLAVLLLLLLVPVLVPAGVASDPSSGSSPPSAAPPVSGTSSWSKNVKVSDDTTGYAVHTEPTIAVDDNSTIVVGWKEANTDEGPGQAVSWSRSTNGGSTWRANAVLAAGSDPWLIRDDNGTFFYAHLGNEIAVHRSSDGGLSWSAAVAASDTAGFADKESIGTDGTRIFMAYDDKGTGLVRASVSTDAAGSFSATSQVSDQALPIGGPFIIGDPVAGRAYCVYMDTNNLNIRFDTSLTGTSWGADVRVNNVAGSASGGSGNWEIPLPAMAVNSTGALFAVWPDTRSGNMDIYSSRSTNQGATWPNNVRVDDDPGSADQWQVSIVVDSRDVLHAIWRDERAGAYEIRYANSSDSGLTWSKSINVTDRTTALTYARPGDYIGLAVGPDDMLYAVWADARFGGNQDIYFASFNQTPPPPPDRPPDVPVVTGPTSGLNRTVLSYQVNGSDPDGDDVTITVTWGDGSNDSVGPLAAGVKRNVTHAWLLPGTYDVIGVARDPDGLFSLPSAALRVKINRTNLPPDTPAPPIGPVLLENGIEGTYTVTGRDPDGDQLRYTIDWNDGSTTPTLLGPSGWVAIVAHAWALEGDYSVSVTATDRYGAASAPSPPLPVHVWTNRPPLAPATPTGPIKGFVGDLLNYTTGAVDPEEGLLEIDLSWGDSLGSQALAVASGADVTLGHSWSAPGTYRLSAVAIDDHQATSPPSGELVVTIRGNDAPSIPILAGPVSAFTGENVSLTVAAVDPDGDPFGFTVDWDDGTTTGIVAATGPRNVTVSHAFVKAGAYLVTAIATDSLGLPSDPSIPHRIGVVVRDRTPPTIIHTPVTSARAGHAIPIRARVTDNVGGDGVAEVLLWVHPHGPGSPVRIAMNLSGRDTYEASIPGTLVVTPSIAYHLQAADRAGNAATLPSDAPATVLTVTVSAPPDPPPPLHPPPPPTVMDVSLAVLGSLITLAVVGALVFLLLALRRRGGPSSTASPPPPPPSPNTGSPQPPAPWPQPPTPEPPVPQVPPAPDPGGSPPPATDPPGIPPPTP